MITVQLRVNGPGCNQRINFKWEMMEDSGKDWRQTDRVGDRETGQTSVSSTSILGCWEMMRDVQCEGWIVEKDWWQGGEIKEEETKRKNVWERENRPPCQCQQGEVQCRWQKEPGADKYWQMCEQIDAVSQKLIACFCTLFLKFEECEKMVFLFESSE